MEREIVIKIDFDFLIEKRLKKIENIKFDSNYPLIFKKNFIKDCEEYIEILKSISDYTTTAKNLAYIIVFHKLWSNKDFDNETLARLFDEIIVKNGININSDDLTIYNTNKENFNFNIMTSIIDKYSNIENYNHITIKDKVLYNNVHTDIYENAYNYFNNKLDEIISNLDNDYNSYVESLPEGTEPITLVEFKKSININGSKLLEEYYNSLNN